MESIEKVVGIGLLETVHSRRCYCPLIMTNSVGLVLKLTTIGSFNLSLGFCHSILECFSYLLETILANIANFSIVEADLWLDS